MRRDVSTSSPAMQRIVAALELYGEMDRDEIVKTACVSRGSLDGGGYMNKLVAECLVHVSGWQRSRCGPPSPLYTAGPGTNRKPPRPYTQAEKSRRWREKTGYRTTRYHAIQNLTAAFAAFKQGEKA